MKYYKIQIKSFYGDRIASSVEGKNVTEKDYFYRIGEVKIISELPYCKSCTGVIQQFNVMFPLYSIDWLFFKCSNFCNLSNDWIRNIVATFLFYTYFRKNS